MGIEHILKDIDGNIAFLTSQIEPLQKRYNCKSAFDLFTKDFGKNVDDKIRVMGYIHRRDAYINIANRIRTEELGATDNARVYEAGEVTEPFDEPPPEAA